MAPTENNFKMVTHGYLLKTSLTFITKQNIYIFFISHESCINLNATAINSIVGSK